MKKLSSQWIDLDRFFIKKIEKNGLSFNLFFIIEFASIRAHKRTFAKEL
jgi:hypothetical protein